MKWLVWLYPRRWRERYAEEFLALVEEQGLSVGAAVDVVRGALDAWLHPELAVSSVPVGTRSSGGRFDKFTPRTRTILQLAEHEARRLRHGQIGTEHLLLGLLLEGKGVAAHVLLEHGVQLDDLRTAILARVQSPAVGNPERLGLSQDAKRAIELSVAEANRLHHDYLGTEHLLLGLVAEGQGIAADELRRHNVGGLSMLRRYIQQVLTEGGPHLRPPAYKPGHPYPPAPE